MSFETTYIPGFYGKLVGSDEIGNKYYAISNNHADLNALKRWVIFNRNRRSKIPHIGMHGCINR